jgi:hypothetical protein
MDGDFIAQQASLLGRLLFGVGIPAIIIGGLELVSWLNARTDVTSNKPAKVLRVASRASAGHLSKPRAISSETRATR